LALGNGCGAALTFLRVLRWAALVVAFFLTGAAFACFGLAAGLTLFVAGALLAGAVSATATEVQANPPSKHRDNPILRNTFIGTDDYP